MSDFVTLTCPSCGGQLQITNDVERFACGHCGNEHIVRRSGGIVAIEPVVQVLRRIQRGTDKTASELAIKRLKGEIEELGDELLQLITREYTRKPGLFDTLSETLTGDILYHALCDTAKDRNLKSHLFANNKEQAESLWRSSVVELEKAIDFVPRICKNKSGPPATQRFGRKILELKKQIEEKTIQLHKHEEIVH